MYPDPKIYVLREVISEKEMARLRELAAPIVSIPTCKCMGVGNFFIVGEGGGGLCCHAQFCDHFHYCNWIATVASGELMRVACPFWQNENTPRAYRATATPLKWK